MTLRRIAKFSQQYEPRELEAFEQNVAAKLRSATTGFLPSDARYTAASPPVLARYGQLIRFDPATSFSVFLPRPDAPGVGPIAFKNETSNEAGILQVLPLDADVTIDGRASQSIVGAYASATFYPDPARKNWIMVLARATQSVLPSFPPVTVAYPSSGSTTAVAFTVPSTPSGVDRFRLGQFYVRHAARMYGSGSVGITVGTATGANDLMTKQSVASGTALGIVGGDILSVGSGMPAYRGYQASLSSGQKVYITATPTGTVTATGYCQIYCYGMFLTP